MKHIHKLCNLFNKYLNYSLISCKYHPSSKNRLELEWCVRDLKEFSDPNFQVLIESLSHHFRFVQNDQRLRVILQLWKEEER